jgi:small subunit ribosomal protein S17
MTVAEDSIRERARRKTRVGVVVSASRQKTITLEIQDSKRHARYDKTVPRRKRLHAHDEENAARVGDTVRVMETRPLSKTKRWRLVDIVERAR